MAILASDPNKKEIDKENGLQPAPGAPSSTPSGPGSFQPSSSAAPTIQNAPTSSGRFQNLQGYLKANENFNAPGGGLAGRITGDITKQKESAQGAIQGAGNQWITQNQEKNFNPVQSSAYVSQSLVNPNEYVGNEPNVAEFQRYLNAGTNYVAPEQFDVGGQLGGQVSDIQSKANLTKDETGRSTLLQNLYNNPFYSSGQSQLDNLILQGNQGQLAQLGNVQTAADELTNVYGSTSTDLGNLATQYGQNAQDVQAATRGALGGAITDFSTYAQGLADEANTGRSQAYTTTKDIFSKGQFTDEDLIRFGLTPQTGYYKDPSAYLRQNEIDARPETVINTEDQARIDALSKLAGNVITGEPSSVLSLFKDNTQVGTYDKTPYGFDTAGFTAGNKASAANLASDIDMLLTPPQTNPVTGQPSTRSYSEFPDLRQVTGNPVEDIKRISQAIDLINDPNAPKPSYLPLGLSRLSPEQKIVQLTAANNLINKLSNVVQTYNLDPATGLPRTIGSISAYPNAGITKIPSYTYSNLKGGLK